MVLTLLWLYISRNFSKIMGLESPEPLANLYSRSYFRATWITTALDAGFWTAMKIRPAWLRDFLSVVFSIYYLFAAEQADEKVRRVRATLTVEHLRVSWNKSTTPYLAAATRLLRPRFTKYPPRAIRIPRPRGSSYKDPVNAWLYFDGPLHALRNQTRLVLDIPGGGYVAMNPRVTDDKLLAWAGKTGVPILSLDYKKAPEYPYPYALHECYDVYRTIMESWGRCVGFSGKVRPRVVITGESAGGNLATGLTIMALQSGSSETHGQYGEDALPPPEGLVLAYPSLDMNIGSWMSEEQMSLIQDKRARKTNENVLRRKSEEYNRLTPNVRSSLDEVTMDYFNHKAHEGKPSNAAQGTPSSLANQAVAAAEKQPQRVQTRLAVSSMVSYFNDRILSPEMMRAMIILYIGPHNRPDFRTDYLLSPILAPEAILARFPKTYILTGERDPLVDDTVIFAGRIRQAKLHRFRERQDLGLEKARRAFNEKDHVEVNLIPGISHGFMIFPSIFPEAWKHIYRSAAWIMDLFARSVVDEGVAHRRTSRRSVDSQQLSKEVNAILGSRRSSMAESDDDRPLEMHMSKFTPLKKTPSSLNGEQSQETNENNQTASGEGSGKSLSKRSLTLSILDKDGVLHSTTIEPCANDVEDEHVLSGGGNSVTRLPSEEDLIGRRMDGLAGGLMGLGEGVRTP